METARESDPSPTGLRSLSAEPVSDLPLFDRVPRRAESASGPQTGRLVTFHELAHLFRPRKRRPKPNPEGQLALLDD
jgi:hypothetical protein